MKTLIYKRTHKGDPNASGCFGIYDCMGRIRAGDFDAVIGVGGIGNEARLAGIAGKVNWIGVGAHREMIPGDRGPSIKFDHFVLFEDKGKNLSVIAPALARRFYADHGPRMLFDDGLTKAEKAGMNRILNLAKKMPPSKGVSRTRLPTVGCPPKKCC